MDKKVCVKCGKEKDISNFVLKKNKRYHSWCNECRLADTKEWRKKNKEHVIKYKEETREYRLKKDAEYRESHREELRIIATIYNEKSKERRRLYRLTEEGHRKELARGRKWRQENKEKYSQYFHDYHEKYPEKKIARNLRNRLRKLLKGISSVIHSNDIAGCSLDFLKKHLESQFQEGMNWDNYGVWHVDHIRPCESFNFRDPEQQRECFLWSNLQPLWGKDNISKNAKWNGIDYRNYNK